MSAISWIDVVGVASEVADVAIETRDTILAVANSAFNVTEWGGESAPKLKIARALLAAHIAVTGPVRGKSGATGPVTSQSAGGLSRSYAVSDPSGEFASSAYGQLLRDLARTTTARGPFLFP